MGKKRRTRRSRRRFRYSVTILIFAFSTLLFLHTHLPETINLPHKEIFKRAFNLPRELEQNRQIIHTTPPKNHSNNLTPATPSPRAIPKGPYPLTPLHKSNSSAHDGTTWSASLTHKSANLPLHWLAELLHAPPKTPSHPSSSIFTARRKGAWIGCDRPTWIICKGAYQAIKKTNAITILDTSCERNVGWLPYVIAKLKTEFRMVRLTCLGSAVSGYDGATKFLESDPFGDLPSGFDLVLAYRFVESGTLISAMKFFKNVKKAAALYLLTENFPGGDNVVKAVEGGTVLRLNAALPPFWFPAPVFEYDEGGDAEVMVVRVGELFEERLTPGMEELVDPRKRIVRE